MNETTPLRIQPGKIFAIEDGDCERFDTARRKVGKCPACRFYLWAEVTLRTTVQKPYWGEGDTARPEVNAFAEAIAMTVTHDCDERREPEETP